MKISRIYELFKKNGFQNMLYYIYKRNNWIIDIRRFTNNFEKISIDRPIFLLGTQGGGLTLVSRILRRNKDVVSVTGNHLYWSGADEMQNVLGRILPPELTGIVHKAPKHPEIPPPRGWSYAVDDLIDKYRNDENDVNVEIKSRIEQIIKWIIYRYKLNDKDMRFIDKSQLYTIKLSFLNELLKEHDPRFILITRNPYAVCYRSAKGNAYDLRLLQKKFGFNQILELASEHWANSMSLVLKDKDKVDNFISIKFEDILKEPEKNIGKLCDFVDLEFNRDMIPQPYHKIPLGSRSDKKWHPLRTDVNKKYLEEMNKQHIEIMQKKFGDYVDMFGYSIPEDHK